MSKDLFYNVTNNIAEIMLARKPSNAFSLVFLRYPQQSKKASNDDDVKVVIIKSDIPNIFCAGLDLSLI